MGKAAFGRALFGLGLFTMLGGLVWGVTQDDLGTELLVAGVGFLLIMIGRSLASEGGS